MVPCMYFQFQRAFKLVQPTYLVDLVVRAARVYWRIYPCHAHYIITIKFLEGNSAYPSKIILVKGQKILTVRSEYIQVIEKKGCAIRSLMHVILYVSTALSRICFFNEFKMKKISKEFLVKTK